VVDEQDSHFTHVDANAPTHEDHRLPNGTDVSGYVIDGILGQGGMGVVYSATHSVIGKRAAIKVLRSEVSMSAITVERFVQEARAVNQIGHPNIIDIFDYGTLPDGRAFHLMDLLVGESLRKRLRRGALHPSEAANVLEGITSALMAAHDKGIVHRDLKPDNIYLITKDEGWPDIKLLDFGLAKLMPEAGAAAFITKTGVMIGTPEYMSPEQARGLPIDYRTDVYALGVLLFEILAGERPFPTMGDAFAMLQCHAEEPPPSIASLVSGLPDEMVQLVDTMLAKEPAARPSLAAVRTVIRRLRSMKLPTKSVAGLEMAALSNPGMSGGINAARVGAEPMVTQSLPTRASNPSIRAAPSPSDPPPMAEDIMATTQRAGKPRFVGATTQPGQPSGLAGASGSVHAATTLGVPPPPRPAPSQRIAAAKPPAAGSNRVWLIVGAVLAVAAGIVLALVLFG
jgi:serine/threonine-protein kinase